MDEVTPVAKRIERYALPVCLLIQAVLLFWRLDLLPIWGDEQVTLDLSSRPLSEIAVLVGKDVHPPLYYFLLHYWIQLPWSASLIVSMRAFSGLWALASTIVLGRMWLRGERRWRFLLLWSLSPCVILYGRMARSYTMQLFLGALALYWGMALYRDPKRRPAMLAYAIAGALLLYTHYVPAFAIIGAIEALLLYRGFRRGDSWIAATAPLAIMLALYGPWLMTMHSAVGMALNSESYALLPNPIVEQALRLSYLAFSFTLGETPPLAVVVSGILLAPLILVALWRGKRPDWLPAVLIAGVIGYVSVTHVVSFAFTPARLLFILPFYLMLLTRRAWMSIVVGCLSMVCLHSYYQQRDFLNKGYLLPFDQIADIIQRDSGPRPARLMVHAPGLDTSPLSRRLGIETSQPANAEVIWVLDNRGAHDPPPGTRQAWRGQFVPYSELDHLAMRLLQWPVQPSHVLELTKYPLR